MQLTDIRELWLAGRASPGHSNALHRIAAGPSRITVLMMWALRFPTRLAVQHSRAALRSGGSSVVVRGGTTSSRSATAVRAAAVAATAAAALYGVASSATNDGTDRARTDEGARRLAAQLMSGGIGGALKVATEASHDLCDTIDAEVQDDSLVGVGTLAAKLLGLGVDKENAEAMALAFGTEGRELSDVRKLVRLRQFAPFANAAYKCTPKKWADVVMDSQRICGTGTDGRGEASAKLQESVVHAKWQSDEGNVAYVLSVDKAAGIVLGLRGTGKPLEAWWDWLTNLQPSPTQFEGSTAHGGMAAAAKRVLDELQRGRHLEAARAEADRIGAPRTITVVGHSLGAGTAVLAALALRGSHSAMCKGLEVHSVTYATPSCLSPELSQRAAAFTDSVVLRADAVPRLSVRVVHRAVRHWAGLPADEAAPLPPRVQQAAEFVTPRGGQHLVPKKETAMWFQAFRDAKGVSPGWHAVASDPSDFKVLVLCESMFSDHDMELYMRVLDEVLFSRGV